jgi:hypothetical protein
MGNTLYSLTLSFMMYNHFDIGRFMSPRYPVATSVHEKKEVIRREAILSRKEEPKNPKEGYRPHLRAGVIGGRDRRNYWLAMAQR